VLRSGCARRGTSDKVLAFSGQWQIQVY
jgi:hypothetical protein